MLNISKELQAALLTDGTHKNLVVPFEQDYDKINFYDAYYYNKDFPTLMSVLRPDLYSSINPNFSVTSDFNTRIHDHRYVVVDECVRFSGFSSETITPSFVQFALRVRVNGSGTYILEEAYEYNEELMHLRFVVDTSEIDTFSYLAYKMLDENKNPYASTESFSVTVHIIDAHVSIGDYFSILPMHNDVQVNYLNLDINDYILPHVGAPLTNENIVRESMSLSENLCTSQEFQFGGCEGACFEFEAMNISQSCVGTYINPYLTVDGIDERIPLGRFRITKETKSIVGRSLIKKKFEAYDDMSKLDIDASDWYVKYMGAINFLTHTGPGYQYTRQMFSTFYNACKSVGVTLDFTEVSDHPSLTLIGTDGKIPLNEDGSHYIEYSRYEFTPSASAEYTHADYFGIDFLSIYDYQTEIKAYLEDPYVYPYTDKKVNDFGVSPANGGIILEVTNSAMSEVIQSACLNDGDIFICQYLMNRRFFLLLPKKYHVKRNNQNIDITLDWASHLSDLKLNRYKFDLFDNLNNEINLVYYNWESLELANGSGTTFRDVIRSLMEIKAGFLKYNRLGDLVFIRSQVAGLYPSNTLYPSNNIYPLSGGSAYLSGAKYKKLKKEDYKVADYGDIEIIGGDTYKNHVIYLHFDVYSMKDNVFYSDSTCTYKKYYDGTDALPQVEEMADNMSSEMERLAYTPYEADVVGLPWIEVGDRVILKSIDGGTDSFVFTRTLKGIQVLTDTFEAYGEK